MTVLTIEEEIIKRLTGFKTYQLHKTHISFEAVERSLIRIQGERRESKIILADHHCHKMSLFATVDMAPNYWAKPAQPKTPDNEQGAPF